MRPRHVYVHVPFCARRCSYCDFSIAIRRAVPWEAFAGAVSREVELRFPGDGLPWEADTLYFGGGTPSRLGAEGVVRLLGALRERVELASGAEVTLETNPEDVTPEAARAWAAAGINRVSLGAQSFDDRVLAWMHRVHDASTTMRAVDVLRASGIGALSVDLIFAVPDVLERDWERDLDAALALSPDHLSLYGLTVEPKTPLGRQAARHEVREAPEERYAAEFLRASTTLTSAGFAHYEVSNFGRGDARGRHNSAYWRGVSYAGFGPSAHEFDGVSRRWNIAPYAAWMDAVAAGIDPVEDEEVIAGAEATTETVYLGLRTTAGLPLTAPEWPMAAPWMESGWAERFGDRIVLTPSGWLRMDAIALTVLRSRL